MPTKVAINGVITGESEARVSVFDRGFLYGDSVFEVLRTYGGRPFAQEAHLSRLAASCARVLIAMPVSIAVIQREMGATLEAAGNGESYIRVLITRGSGPVNYDPSTAQNPLRVIIVTELPALTVGIHERGIAVALVRVNRPIDHENLAGAKASNYLPNLLAVHGAKQKGASEAILLGANGEVLEGASSNVFVVRHGELATPPLGSGILAGITRSTVVHVARTESISIREATLFPRDLYDADEVFITSTLREVLPVVKVDDHPIGDGRPGPVTGRLLRAYRSFVALETD